MKVAFTTSAGALVDGNFRTANNYTVWDVGPRESYYVTTVTIKADGGSEDDRITVRAEALRECAIVCAREINGPAAAKLIGRNIQPLKTRVSVPLEEIITRLQDVLQGTPPPWLRKAMVRDLYDEPLPCDGGSNPPDFSCQQWRSMG